MKHYNLKILLSLLITLFFFQFISAQSSKPLWTKTSKDNVSKSGLLVRNTFPSKASYFKLDVDGLKEVLLNAPDRNRFNGVSNVIIVFPTEKGEFESFRVKESSNFSPQLQAKFPDIRSYSGQGIENPAATISFTISPNKGLSSMVLSNKKTIFIEPYTNDLNTYIVYINSSEDKNDANFICETLFSKKSFEEDSTFNKIVNDGQLRTFRLALACTGEYATFHGGTKPLALAAMNVTMARVNGVFERDVAIRMEMVDNTEIIFLDGATDPYTNTNGSNMLGQNQTTIDNEPTIGAAGYDIGHVFSTGGGGVAILPSPCVNGDKAKGVTGLAAPVGDMFDIDFVAHEMGHQFGANHTQNNNCQRSAVSVEPGSASTIMGYAGICAPNVQNNSDDYFHGENIKEMWANITTGASQCGAQSPTGNTAPTSDAGSDYTIPKSTPFVLRGVGADADVGNSLTYCWEQIDATPATMPPVSTSTVGPAFRSLLPNTSPNRYMPDYATVLAGSTSSTWEVVPSVGRVMNFSLTVRDNAAGGASSATDNTVITVEGTAGPFLVTSQNTEGISWAVGSTQTVTWDKANTDIAPVSTANVNIWLSVDGGLTFTVPLATGVPNIGTYEISSIPDNTGPYCRVMVEGANNIFYNVNTVDFAVGYSVITTCNQYPSTNPAQPIQDNSGGFNPTDGITVPLSSTIEDINIGVNITHPRIGDLLVAVLSPDGNQINLMNPGDCSTEDDLIVKFDDDGDLFNCADSGTNQIFQSLQESLSLLNGEESSGVWTFGVGDFAPGQTGTLNSWYVEVCSTTITPLSLDEFELDSFSVYPNPNQGEFTVKLNSNSGNKVNISVYDIRGRRVFDHLYLNSSNFKEVVNLNNVQSGMYVLKVSDGEKSSSKKIIIN